VIYNNTLSIPLLLLKIVANEIGMQTIHFNFAINISICSLSVHYITNVRHDTRCLKMKINVKPDIYITGNCSIVNKVRWFADPRIRVYIVCSGVHTRSYIKSLWHYFECVITSILAINRYTCLYHISLHATIMYLFPFFHCNYFK
jgi:hypothetical protein